jgi:hypothetical protein
MGEDLAFLPPWQIGARGGRGQEEPELPCRDMLSHESTISVREAMFFEA